MITSSEIRRPNARDVLPLFTMNSQWIVDAMLHGYAVFHHCKGESFGAGQGTLGWHSTYDKDGLYPQREDIQNSFLALAAIGVTAKLDVFRNIVLIEYQGEVRELQEFAGGDLTDRAEDVINNIFIDRFDFDPSQQRIHRALCMLAAKNAFDPVLDDLADWEAKWDGECRLHRAAVDYFSAEDTPLNRRTVMAALVASVRRARDPGSKYDIVTTMESPEGFAKSSVLAALYGEDYFSDQRLLDKNDREIQEHLDGTWGYECADLAGMSRSEIEHTKALISRVVDRA